MSSFKDLGVLHSQFSVADAQRSYAYAALNCKTEREHACNSFGVLSQGYCKRKTPKS